MFNIGDTYLCKCNREFRFEPEYYVTEGEYYQIHLYTENFVLIDNGKKTIHFLTNYSSNTNYWYFYNAFYTKKEERLIKLKKIQNTCQ